MSRIQQLTIETPRSTVHADCKYPHSAARLTDRGFTLIEIIVILAVISILAAILTPTVLKFIEEAQVTSAEEDVRNINAALNDLIKDTRKFPGNKTVKNFLCSPGTISSDNTGTWATGSGDCSDLFDHLIVNNPDGDGNIGEPSDDYKTSGKRRHRGPYLSKVEEDPFDTAFQVHAATLKGGNTSVTWVISAGPDGIIQTATTATSLSGDDIGIRIK